jgi:hypothetical protein
MFRALPAQSQECESSNIDTTSAKQVHNTNNTTTNGYNTTITASSVTRTSDLVHAHLNTDHLISPALPMSARRMGTPAPLDVKKQQSSDSGEMAPDSAVPPSPPASDLDEPPMSTLQRATANQQRAADDLELSEESLFDVDTSETDTKANTPFRDYWPLEPLEDQPYNLPPYNQHPQYYNNQHVNIIDAELDDQFANQSDDSGAFDDVAMHTPVFCRPRTKGAGLLMSKMGTSLPVTINQRYWPPKDALDSANHTPGDDEEGNPKNVCLPHRAPRDQHEKMRELSRTIQAADDPERLFGERPRRRRYKTGAVVRLRSLNIDAADLDDEPDIQAQPVLIQAQTRTYSTTNSMMIGTENIKVNDTMWPTVD